MEARKQVPSFLPLPLLLLLLLYSIQKTETIQGPRSTSRKEYSLRQRKWRKGRGTGGGRERKDGGKESELEGRRERGRKHRREKGKKKEMR